MRIRIARRCGTTILESALIYPLVFLFCLGLVVGAMGVFRYDELASLARRGARYASVHGTQYAKDTGNAAATPTDIYNNAILPFAATLDTSKLTYSVTYDTTNSPNSPVIVNGQPVGKTNTVSVTVSYQWIPEVSYFPGVTLSSTSVMAMSY